MGISKGIELGFLLAAPRLGDANFNGSVVLLGVHDASGSLGWTINGDALQVAAKIVRATGLVAPQVELPAEFDRQATSGGPVSPESVWILHRRRDDEEPLPGTITIGEAVGVSSSPEALAALVAGRGPKEFRLLLGYAGWGAGQLADEVAQGAWLPAKVDPELLFDTPADTVWQRAFERAIGTIPAAFVMPKPGSHGTN